MWIRRPANDKSVTLTFFVVGYIIALLKLIFAGVELGSFKVGAFSGADFALVVGAVGGLYSIRRATKKKDADNC